MLLRLAALAFGRQGCRQNVRLGALLLVLTHLSYACSVDLYVSPTMQPASRVPPCGRASDQHTPDQSDGVEQTLFLVGDAGGLPSSDPDPHIDPLTELECQAAKTQNVTIVFLGDNLYPSGVNQLATGTWLAPLERQIEVVRSSQARGIFIPGNHDWNNLKPDGLARLYAQAYYVTRSGEGWATEFKPLPGCLFAPVDLSPWVNLTVLDTQWWIRGKPDPPCDEPGPTRADLKAELKERLTGKNRHRYNVVVAHHPLVTHGEHGGFFDWHAWLFPLRELVANWLWVPVPALWPLLRKVESWQEDISSTKAYQDLIQLLLPVLNEGPLLAYASGHEHSLQVLRLERGAVELVSGFGTPATNGHSLRKGMDTLVAASRPGFMSLEFFASGKVQLNVYTVDEHQRRLEKVTTVIGEPSGVSGRN